MNKTMHIDKNLQIFFCSPKKKIKGLGDFKKYIIASGKNKQENISENIDTIIYI